MEGLIFRILRYLNTIRKFTLFLCLHYIKACVLYIASTQEKS